MCGITHLDLNLLLDAKEDDEYEDWRSFNFFNCVIWQNLRTLWLEPGISPHDIKANSPIKHHCILRVNIQVLKNITDKKTVPVGIYGLMA